VCDQNHGIGSVWVKKVEVYNSVMHSVYSIKSMPNSSLGDFPIPSQHRDTFAFGWTKEVTDFFKKVNKICILFDWKKKNFLSLSCLICLGA
jgi:hypothetical protein